MADSSARRDSLTVVGVVALLVVVAFLSWHVANRLLLTFFGVLLAVMFSGLAGQLSRRLRLPYGAAVGVVVLAMLGLLAATGLLLGPRLSNELDRLGGQVSGAVAELRGQVRSLPGGQWMLDRLPDLSVPGTDAAAAEERMTEADPAETPILPPQEPAAGADGGGEEEEAAAQNLAGAVAATLRGVITAFADLFYVVIIGIFLALNPDLYRSGVIRLFPRERRDGVRRTLDEVASTLHGWLLGQLVAMVTIAALAGIGLALLGVPLVLALVFLTFLFEFIPTVGPWLAGIPAVLVALTQGPSTALWVILLYVGIELAEGNLLYPVIQKHAAHLPPALTIFAIFVMGALFGFVGVLVAAPLAATLLTIVRINWVEDALEGGRTGDDAPPRRASTAD